MVCLNVISKQCNLKKSNQTKIWKIDHSAEAEALLQLSTCQESDKDIISDQSSVTDLEDPMAKNGVNLVNRTKLIKVATRRHAPFGGVEYGVP